MRNAAIHAPALAKFADPVWTAKGESRAAVALKRLDTLWFNTGTLCNIECANCYIESSPRNGRLAYLSLGDVTGYLDEIRERALGVRLIGFTGGEPFMNPQFMEILEETLKRGFQTLTLTNGMKPMDRKKEKMLQLVREHGPRVRLRVSLDDWRPEIHDGERGAGSFAKALETLQWLSRNGVAAETAGRFLSGDSEESLRAGYARLFSEFHIAVDASDPQALVLLPEMNPEADPPEITEACWDILHKSPDDVMCASARMVVRRRGAERPTVLACTLLPYDERFDLGSTLDEAKISVPLAHPYCASFCVLGGGSCGSARGASPAHARRT